MQKKLNPRHILVIFCTCLAELACAVEVPDAGMMLKQLDGVVQRQRPSIGEVTKPAVAAPINSATDSQESRVFVRSIQVTGSVALDSQLLQQLVQPWTGRELSFGELSQALDAVSRIYLEQGRVARVYFPQQDVTDGVIRIAVIESIMGDVRLSDASHRVDKAWLKDYLARHLPASGDPVLTPAIERQIMVANEVPGLGLKGNLISGRQEAQTDLLLSVSDKPLISGLVMADNAGQYATGKERAIGVVSLNGPGGQGEELTLTLLKTQGIDFARSDIWLTDPWVSGLRLGWSNSFMNYRIVQGDQLSNHPLGSARSFGAQAAYAISRAQGRQLNWKASFEHKGFSNQNATGLVSDYANIVLNQQLSGFSVDGEGGMNVYHLSFTSGRVGLSGSPNQQDDAATAKTEGGFVKWNYGFTRQQLLSQQWTLSLAYAGQWSRRNLDSSEKFYIGGPSSVRAYPASEGGGARGYQFNLDLRYAVDNQKSVSVFYDYGRVRVAAQPWDNHINDLALHGRGVSAQWDLTPKTRLKATMAWRTGANPNPTASGTDQDGTRKEPRFWFEATQNF